MTLRGAAVNIDASAKPATVTATGQITTFGSRFNQPQALAFDAQGNLYVGDSGANTVSRVTPAGDTTVSSRTPPR